MTLREQFDAVVAVITDLREELRRLAVLEAEGHERPALQAVCMLAMPAIQAQWSALKRRLEAGDDEEVIVRELRQLFVDVAFLRAVLAGQVKIVGAPDASQN
jgi:hypothetical protein